MRRATPVLMTIVFAVIAAVPLSAAVRAAGDPAFRPGNFPVDLMALTGAVLAGVAVAWFLQSRGPHRVGGWMITIGGLIGLLIGAFGIWGTSVLMGDCAGVRAMATSTPIDPSNPNANCDLLRSSLMIGYFMIAVGIASVVSFVASAWVSRSVVNAALD